MTTEIQIMNEEFDEICKEHDKPVHKFEVITNESGDVKGYKDFIHKIYIPYIRNR